MSLQDLHNIQNIRQVKKRNGHYADIDFSKIRFRLNKLTAESNIDGIHLPRLSGVNVEVLSSKIERMVIDKMSTNQIDREAANKCAELAQVHPDYIDLASRILISNHHKNTRGLTFMGVVEKLYQNKSCDESNGSNINHKFYKFTEKNSKRIEELINYERDYLLTYFGFTTLEKKYLLRLSGEKNPIERPQHTFMRIAIAVSIGGSSSLPSVPGKQLDSSDKQSDRQWAHIVRTYNALSNNLYTHASPTIFNIGTNHQQCISCYLLGSEDSREGIMKLADDISNLSKWAGGIGFHFDWRASGSLIKGTNGKSSGPRRFLQIIEGILRAFDQGGARPGAGAAYCACDHPDAMEHLQLRDTHKSAEFTTPDLFLASSLNDLFMVRCIENKDWSFFDPNKCPGLSDSYGDEYEKLYLKYEAEGKATGTVKAREFAKILAERRIENGLPYEFQKDMVNRRSNQKNIGTIRSSNLCAEIVEYSSSKEYACCDLASICLPKFVRFGRENKEGGEENKEGGEESKEDKQKNKKNKEGKQKNKEGKEGKEPWFDFNALAETCMLAIRNLDNIIDINWYPVVEAKVSNMRHRPLGLGVQGLADTYIMMRMPFESENAMKLNKLIFETIYYATMVESCKMARERYLNYRTTLKNNGCVKVEVGFKVRRKFTDEDNNIKKEWVEPIYKTYVLTKQSTETDSQTDSQTDSVNCPADNSTVTVLENISDLPNDCGTYSSYKMGEGSPMSHGKFQFDLWNDEFDHLHNKYNGRIKFAPKAVLSGMWDWTSLRNKIALFGVRNSLTVALMPTASTAQIMGNNEAIEPYTTNVYRRETLVGDFICVNKHLIRDLISLGVWNGDLENNLIANNGSIQYIDGLPQEIKDLYKTSWEISMKTLMRQASDRSPFVDQSQSLNLFLSKDKKTPKIVMAISQNAWRLRLKTLYYLRTQDVNNPIKFTIEPDTKKFDKYLENNRSVVDMSKIATKSEPSCLSCSG